MDVRVLQYFLTVAREGSISRGAEKLNMTQPPLSRQLHDLEDELGKQLFIRGTKKITLTEEGLLLQNRAEEILELVDRTKAEVSAISQDVTGDVYIGSGETEAMLLISETISKLQREYPQIHCHITTGSTPDLVDDLDRGLLDFAVLMAPIDRSKYNFVRLPVTDAWGVLMREDSPLAAKTFITPEDLAGQPIIAPRQLLLNQDLSGWISKGARAINVVATYSLLFNAALLVEAGVGYALGIDKVNMASNREGLCRRMLDPAIPVRFDMGWKKDRIHSKAAEVFLETLRSLIL